MVVNRRMVESLPHEQGDPGTSMGVVSKGLGVVLWISWGVVIVTLFETGVARP